MKKVAFSVVMGWILGLSLLVPSEGSAAQVFYSGTMCVPQSSSTAYSVNGGGLVNASGSAATFTCPFPSGDYLRHTDVTHANVALWDASTVSGPSAQFCVRDWTLNSGSSYTACSSWAGVGAGSATGAFAASPSLTEWNSGSHTSWYPYINVTLNVTNSAITGIYADDV